MKEHVNEKSQSQQFMKTPDYKHMNAVDLMLNRHSVRLHNIDDKLLAKALSNDVYSKTFEENSQKEIISDEVYKKAFRCCIQAPSACNKQPCHFFLTRDVDYIMKEYHKKHNYLHCNPSEIIICCVDSNAIYESSEHNDMSKYQFLDLGLAIENLLLALTYENISTCIYNAMWNMKGLEKIKERYNIPKNMIIGCFIYCGKMNKYIQFLPSKREQELHFR